jgi:hypothetical protein
MKQRHGLSLALLAVLCGALTVGGGAGSRAFAQGKKGWEILVAYSSQPDMPKDLKQIALRPNVTQSVYLYLRNTDLDEETEVDIRLERAFIKGKVSGKVEQWRDLAKAKLKKDFRRLQLVTFKPAPEPAKKEAAKGPPTTPNEEGAPFHFQLAITEEGKQTVTFDLPVKIQQPQEYMANATAQFDKKESRLSARLIINADSADPPCPVELVLDPEVVPGARSLSEYELNSMDRDVTLKAEKVTFAHDIPPENGRISLTVDGFKRAFLFKTAFEQGALERLKQTRVRLIAPRYFSPTAEAKAAPKGEVNPNPKIPVDIEADGTDAAKWIEVALDRSGERKYIRQYLLPGIREQAISFAVGPEGSPQFTTLARDWKVALDVRGISGKRLLRVQVLDRKEDPLELADEQTEKDEAVYLFSRDPKRNPHAPLLYDKNDKAVYAEIIVDKTAPEGLQLVDLPKKAAPGDKIKLLAKVNERDNAEQAPISKVEFFLGDSPKDPPIPAVFDRQNQHWQADITVPDVKEKLSVAVRATTAAGLSAKDEGMIALGAAQEGNLEKSKITGLVKRDDRIQPDRPVTLTGGGKTQVNMKTKTNDQGVYLFQNVPAGKYQVTASVPGYSKGTAAAVVPKDTGETIKADINLKAVP